MGSFGQSIAAALVLLLQQLAAMFGSGYGPPGLVRITPRPAVTRRVPATPTRTLDRARKIALSNGILYAYTGNVHDIDGGSTYCHGCGGRLIGRDWYVLGEWNLTADGRCRFCDLPCAGRFAATPGSWGARRLPVRLRDFS